MEKYQFQVSGSLIPSVTEKLVKSLGKIFDDTLRDSAAIQSMHKEFKNWLSVVGVNRLSALKFSILTYISISLFLIQRANLKLVILAQMQPRLSVSITVPPTAPSDWLRKPHRRQSQSDAVCRVLKQTAERKVFSCGEAPEGVRMRKKYVNTGNSPEIVINIPSACHNYILVTL